ncbi:MAG TPA: crotonase/enoyl-CoA hydratase family protein [Acidimicrobiales bacterium]|nr:crotonase/enoyl-CoA hydratase family protein [Acidimicrobiales bacterium]
MPDAIVERDGHVMTITMNRPKRFNALSGAMLIRMYDAMVEASNDPEIRAIILTGAGGNFCSGADLRAMSGDAEDTDGEIDVEARNAAEPGLGMKALLRDWRPTKPVIAAVEGVAIAGGTEILQGTDIRVGAQGARFGVSEARWSLYPMAGSAVRLRRQIPYTVAADILLTAKHVTAEEAYRIGLIAYLVPDGQALAKAREVAEVIAGNGPLAVAAILKTLHETDGMTEKEALAYELEYGRAVFSSNDAKEGPLAFSEKRRPVFTGS